MGVETGTSAVVTHRHVDAAGLVGSTGRSSSRFGVRPAYLGKRMRFYFESSLLAFLISLQELGTHQTRARPLTCLHATRPSAASVVSLLRFVRREQSSRAAIPDAVSDLAGGRGAETWIERPESKN